MKQKNDVLLLLLDDRNFFGLQSSRRAVDVKKIYTDIPYILKYIRRLHMYLKLPFFALWYSKWKKDLHQYKTIIIHSSIVTVPVVSYINNKKKCC